MAAIKWTAGAIAAACGIALAAAAWAADPGAEWRALVAAAGAAFGRGEYRAAEGKLTEALAAVQQSHPDGPEIGIDGVGSARVPADRDRLQRVIINLLDNARRHAASRIEVSLRVDDGVVTSR